MKNLLITGATGFIGGRLVQYFLKKGVQILAQGSSMESFNRLKINLERNGLKSKNIEYWSQDFLKEKWNFPDFSELDALIHCAAATRVREGTLENYDKYFTLNVLATKILAKKALENNINHFIHLSTGQVFGRPPSFPINEQTPKKPINLYGITKLIGEHVIVSLGILENGLNYTIVRPFSVYGKGHYNIISIITEKLLNNEPLTIFGDGNSRRAFSHVKDFCNAISLIINNKKCFKEEYNLSGAKEYSINELVELISKKLRREPNIKRKKAIVDELKRNIADLSKIKALGFNPKESLKKFIENDLV